ncbi:hypothetical protein WN51_11024 [Melipona quadrifasciata]|uniref:Uncharacterized protein n=1 Tax=Melipona quadrifasciata TaxID=166423 RepID=A0A0N0U6D1_9HYME|nr:hypothetical protein WN51_11024 [Melipona quadrifasciata]
MQMVCLVRVVQFIEGIRITVHYVKFEERRNQVERIFEREEDENGAVLDSIIFLK